MVILLFVWLVCSLVVDGLTSQIPPQTRTCVPSWFTTDVPFHGMDEMKSDVAFTPSGDKRNHCAAFGHPEICCPPDTTCRGSSQTSSHVFCCPNGSSCSDAMAECPMHTIECPASVGGGCCAVGLRCASDLCLEFHYKTLAVFQPLPTHNRTPLISQGFYDCIIPATVGPVQTSILPSSLSTARVVPTYVSQNCQPKNIIQKGQDLPISDRILGTPTAWRAKFGEIAVRKRAEVNGDGENGVSRLQRLGCVIMGLLLMTVVMFVF